jgi:hypothetical protein
MSYQHWYSFLVPSKDDSKKVNLLSSEKITQGNVIICQHVKYRKFSKFIDFYSALKFVYNTNFVNNCFFEVIRGSQSQKFYIDCDIYISDSKEDQENENFYVTISEVIPLILNIKDKLKIVLPMIKDSDIIVTESNDSKKHSYHIIVDNWCASNNDVNKVIFNNLIELLPIEQRNALDHSMYSNIQQFRLYNSHKFGSNRVKRFCDDLSTWKPSSVILNTGCLERLRFLGSCVTNTLNCSHLPIFGKLGKTIGTFSSVVIDQDDLKKIMNIFNEVFENSSSFKYESTDGCFIILKRLRPSMCTSCQRVHQAENPYLIVTGEERNIYFDCRRNNKSSAKIYIGSIGSPNTIEEPLYKSSMDLSEMLSMVSPIIVTKKSILNGLTSEPKKVSEQKKVSEPKKVSEAKVKKESIFKIFYSNYSQVSYNTIGNLQKLTR